MDANSAHGFYVRKFKLIRTFIRTKVVLIFYVDMYVQENKLNENLLLSDCLPIEVVILLKPKNKLFQANIFLAF